MLRRCHAASAQLLHELVWRYIERVLLKDAANNNHWVCAHDVNYDLPAKLGEIVRSYHWVFVAGQKIIESCLVLNEIVDARTVLERPFHVGNQPR